jgi:hypothetical protein
LPFRKEDKRFFITVKHSSSDRRRQTRLFLSFRSLSLSKLELLVFGANVGKKNRDSGC